MEIRVVDQCLYQAMYLDFDLEKLSTMCKELRTDKKFLLEAISLVD